MLDRVKMKKRRVELKMSQADAAAKAGFKSRQQWSNIERDGTGYAVSMATLDRIAKALGVKAKDLLK